MFHENVNEIFYYLVTNCNIYGHSNYHALPFQNVQIGIINLKNDKFCFKKVNYSNVKNLLNIKKKFKVIRNNCTVM